MTKSVKNQVLRYLYNLKSFGFSYHESFDIFSKEIKNFKLPNDIKELKNSVEHCYLCELCKVRKNVLFGYGNINSKIMFICDEPTKSEDELGSFYVGNSGELLSKMIENVLNIKKEDVYITTLVKCKSLNGATNSSFDTCNDYLLKQIELIKPKLIVSLGEKTYSYLMKNGDSFFQIRGKILNFNSIALMAVYSPTFLLRNPSLKKDAYYDMLKIKSFMEELN
ncbi:uracil-DNA glycosylase [Aliarcobacter butzleri]|uniref:uracil-DNA glycosylase n=1 Tax=Aliarcobacter butzleri TaxID=28197 RepID=UPI00263D236C|nr:uracil-DNA glycosylase [Aliarcobacter butzleri]MDN5077066.1 uracil-DNA glycosylase [Aliarcobacter butzleri]MDN5118108.1 uracil-DNA glycosylase [Aliarcobacter butzleri]